MMRKTPKSERNAEGELPSGFWLPTPVSLTSALQSGSNDLRVSEFSFWKPTIPLLSDASSWSLSRTWAPLRCRLVLNSTKTTKQNISQTWNGKPETKSLSPSLPRRIGCLQVLNCPQKTEMMAGDYPEFRTILNWNLTTVFPQFRGDWNGLRPHLEVAHHTGGTMSIRQTVS